MYLNKSYNSEKEMEKKNKMTSFLFGTEKELIDMLPIFLLFKIINIKLNNEILFIL